MDTLLQDLKFAARSAARRPGPTTLALLTFALGIAASTAMFSVVDAVLLRPLPYPEPERIVSVYAKNPSFAGHPTLGFAAERGSLSLPEFRTLHDNDGALEGLAVLGSGGAVLYGDGEPERIALGITTTDLFARVLRVTPLFGRVFAEEDGRGQAPVIVLTEGFWRRRFGADPSIVGGTLRLGDTPYAVLGVVPEEAQLAGFDVDAWALANPDDNNWGNHWLVAIGRLSPGVGPEQASARLAAILENGAPADQKHEHGINAFVRQGDETRAVRGPLVLLTVASLVLLLVACGNVAALLVGAAIDREQELAVRAALGAKRGRLVRQLLTESAGVALVAAGAGVLLAFAATRALVLLAPEGVPRIANATVDGRVLAFGIAVSLTCGLLFGLIPALGFSRTDLRRSMTISTRGTTGYRGRVQGVVVIAELALATVLLVGAGLLTRTVFALNAANPGFAAGQTLGVRFSVPFSRIAGEQESDSARLAAYDVFMQELVAQLRGVQGVRGVALTSNLPLSPDRSNNDVQPEGYDGDPLIAERRFVSHEYFDVMGIRIIQGRAFSAEEDRPGVDGRVVVSEGLARLAWPDGNAVGKRFRYWGTDNIVVGVAADIRDEEVQGATALSFYAPRRQAGQLGASLVIRTDGDPTAIAPALRQRIRQVHESIAIISMRPMSELIADDIAAQRYRARLILVFAVLAAVFAVMGIYGVTARSVASRTRELGIRMALGAAQKRILRLVVRQAIRLALAGALLGILVSLIVTRGIEAYLWGVGRTDPLTLVLIALLLGAASVLAALGPGRRATKVEPMVALRVE
jgi:predicted permease